MIRNKMKLLTIILSVLFIFQASFAYAENTVMPISENPEAPVTTDITTDTTNNPEAKSDPKSNMKQSDVYLTGDNITVDYVIDGNLFVIANSVTINSEIGGDAFIIANEVTISEQGYIFSNLFTTATNVTVKGVVYDLYAITNNINISGYVYRDVKAFTTNSISILGTIGRNAFLNGTSNISLKDTAENSAVQGTISGNLEYSAKTETTIPEGTVSGKVTYNPQTLVNTTQNNSNVALVYLTNLGSSLGLLVIVWLILLWLTPKFVEATSKIVKTKALPVIVLGILGLILIPIISLILLLLGVTSMAGFIILGLYFLLLTICSPIFAITASNLISEKLKVNKTIGKFGILLLTGIVIWAICLIPYIGIIISFIITILGLGIFLTNLISKKEAKNKEPKAKPQTKITK